MWDGKQWKLSREAYYSLVDVKTTTHYSEVIARPPQGEYIYILLNCIDGRVFTDSIRAASLPPDAEIPDGADAVDAIVESLGYGNDTETPAFHPAEVYEANHPIDSLTTLSPADIIRLHAVRLMAPLRNAIARADGRLLPQITPTGYQLFCFPDLDEMDEVVLEWVGRVDGGQLRLASWNGTQWELLLESATPPEAETTTLSATVAHTKTEGGINILLACSTPDGRVHTDTLLARPTKRQQLLAGLESFTFTFESDASSFTELDRRIESIATAAFQSLDLTINTTSPAKMHITFSADAETSKFRPVLAGTLEMTVSPTETVTLWEHQRTIYNLLPIDKLHKKVSTPLVSDIEGFFGGLARKVDYARSVLGTNQP